MASLSIQAGPGVGDPVRVLVLPEHRNLVQTAQHIYDWRATACNYMVSSLSKQLVPGSEQVARGRPRDLLIASPRYGWVKCQSEDSNAS